MREAWIVSAVRTPVGRYGGALARVRPDDLAALVIRAAVERSTVRPDEIDDVIMGCANQAGEDNRNVARMSALLAGLPVEVPGLTVNRLCGSGLQAINSAAHAIMVGDGDAFVAGGVESMTRAPYVMAKPEAGFDRGNREMYDTTLGWRFTNPKLAEMHNPYSMGETGENVAERCGVSREEQDEFALRSHRRAIAAIEEGRFQNQIVPVMVPQPKGEPVTVDRDEHPRADTSMEALARLRPAFRRGWHCHGRQQLGHQRWRERDSGRREGICARARHQAHGAGARDGGRWCRPGSHGPWSRAGDTQGARAGRARGRGPRLDRTQ